jgi:hypothetical protein
MKCGGSCQPLSAGDVKDEAAAVVVVGDWYDFLQANKQPPMKMKAPGDLCSPTTKRASLD